MKLNSRWFDLLTCSKDRYLLLIIDPKSLSRSTWCILTQKVLFEHHSMIYAVLFLTIWCSVSLLPSRCSAILLKSSKSEWTGVRGLCEEIHLFMGSVIKFDSCCIWNSICQIKEVIITISQTLRQSSPLQPTGRVQHPWKKDFMPDSQNTTL